MNDLRIAQLSLPPGMIDFGAGQPSPALLPLALPSIMLGLLLVTVEVISDYGTATVLGIHTLTTTVHRVWFELYNPNLAAQVALFSALAVYTQQESGAVRSLESAGPIERVVTSSAAYWTYLWKTFAPFNLTVFYPAPDSPPYAQATLFVAARARRFSPVDAGSNRARG